MRPVQKSGSLSSSCKHSEQLPPCPIAASSPPRSTSRELEEALQEFLALKARDPWEQRDWRYAWQRALRICIQERNGPILEWLSRRSEPVENHKMQPVAGLQLTEDMAPEALEWVVNEWCISRMHPVPIGFTYSFWPRAITEDEVQLVAKLLQTTPVRALSLASCSLNDQHMGVIAEELKRHPHLKVLNLGSNRFTDKGLGMLALALKANEKLTAINLDQHRSNGGIAAICKAAQKSPNLEEFSLRSARGASKDAKALGELIEANTLHHLDIRDISFYPHCEYDSRHKKSIKQAVKRELRRGVLTRKSKTSPLDVSLAPIYTGIATSTSLMSLSLGVDHLGKALAEAIASTLRSEHCHLSFLEIHIGIGGTSEEAKEILKPALRANKSLLTFVCSNLALQAVGQAVTVKNCAWQQQMPSRTGWILGLIFNAGRVLPLDLSNEIAKQLIKIDQMNDLKTADGLVEAAFGKRPL